MDKRITPDKREDTFISTLGTNFTIGYHLKIRNLRFAKEMAHLRFWYHKEPRVYTLKS